MRTAITALVALAAVAAAGWLGWSLLAPRVDPDTRDLDGAETLQAFARALDARDAATMEQLVHRDDQRDLDQVLDLASRISSGLDATDVAVTVADLSAGDENASRASATLDWSMTVPTATTPLPAPTPSAPDGAASTATANTPSTIATTGAAPPGDSTSRASASDDPASGGATLTWQAAIGAERRTSGWVVVPDAAIVHADLAGIDPALVSLRRRTTELGRAPLLDIDGNPLTSHTDLVTIGIAPGQLTDPQRAQQVWARVLPTTLDQFREVAGDDSLRPEWFHPVVTVSADEAERVWPELRRVPGILRQSAETTADAATTFGTHVLGRVGLPTAEQVAEWGVPEGEPTGLAGLERVFQERLAAATRTTVTLIDDEGPAARLGAYSGTGTGAVTTSIERPVQEAVEAAMTGVSSTAAIAVVRTDGGVAAAASRPLQGYNRAFEARLAPGDAFVPITALALAGAGLTGDEQVACEARAVIVGAPMTAPTPAGQTDLATAMATGCDPAVGAAVRDHEPGLVGVANALGIAQAPELAIPTGSGTFPRPVDLTETVRAGVGSGRVGMTPLQVATTAAEIAADADLSPWLVPGRAVEPSPWDQDPALARRVLEGGIVGDGSAVGFLPESRRQTVRDGWAGAVAGTGQATGDDTTHSWVMAVVGDLGIAVAVQDSGGDLTLARELTRRLDRELAARLGG